MGKHMDEKTKALCYFYRNPPKGSGVKPSTFKTIGKLAVPAGKMPLEEDKVRWAVKNFHGEKSPRGRKKGWRKTTAAEDNIISQTFARVRQPLGSLVESRDVWSALPPDLRRKTCLRTVRNRLREKGYAMDEKRVGDDQGEEWRKRLLAFCKPKLQRSEAQWRNAVQAVGDFKMFTFFPRSLKGRHRVKSCSRTIMRRSEKNKGAFLKPRNKILSRSDWKKCTRAKVFGLTTSTGEVLAIPTPLHPTASDWIKLVQEKIGAFMAAAFPKRASYVILLDGEKIMHTDEAKAAMQEVGIRPLPDWPSYSPDLNPQENVWAWAEPQLRKTEKKEDEVSTFKRRIIAVCKKYPGKDKLVPNLATRMRKCVKLRGENIGK